MNQTKTPARPKKGKSSYVTILKKIKFFSNLAEAARNDLKQALRQLQISTQGPTENEKKTELRNRVFKSLPEKALDFLTNFSFLVGLALLDDNDAGIIQADERNRRVKKHHTYILSISF